MNNRSFYRLHWTQYPLNEFHTRLVRPLSPNITFIYILESSGFLNLLTLVETFPAIQLSVVLRRVRNKIIQITLNRVIQKDNLTLEWEEIKIFSFDFFRKVITSFGNRAFYVLINIMSLCKIKRLRNFHITFNSDCPNYCSYIKDVGRYLSILTSFARGHPCYF